MRDLEAVSAGESPTHELGRSRSFVLLTVVALLAWLALSLPLALGQETLYFRDVFSTHLPLKAFGAEALQQGEIPALNPTWALGQPFRGNPNAVAFYPGNLLYLVLPFWPAFNLHYVLHWLLAGVGMFLLARSLDRSREAALLAALAYAGSGWMLAVLTFYNLLVVVAWWPLVLLAAVQSGRGALALGGLACGMALLGGEPVTALLGTVPLFLLASRARGVRRGARRTAAIGIASLAVALPQLIATSRFTATSFRGAHGLVASQASYFSLEPLRVLELLLPHPFGLAGWHGSLGTNATGALDHLPFYFSIHFGSIAFVLALVAARRQPLLALLAGLSLLFAWLGGLSGDLLLTLSAGLFRSPEKLLFWLALALPLLAAAGLDRLRGGLSRGASRAMLLAAVVMTLAALALLARGRISSDPSLLGADGGVARAQSGLWITGLLVAGALLAGMTWLTQRGGAEWLVGLQLVGLVQLAPLWMTDDVAAYAAPGPGGDANHAVVVSQLAYPPWPSGRVSPDLPSGPPASNARWLAAQWAPAPGVLLGHSYPLAPDLDGMHHLFYGLLEVEMARVSWTERLRWLEVLGADRLTTPGPVPLAELQLSAHRTVFGDTLFFHTVPSPLPLAWWPERVDVAPDPRAAFHTVARSPAGSRPGILPQPIEHRAGGRVDVLAASPDRIRLEVESDGGLVVVQRAYQPVWRARAADLELVVLPADLALLGVVVPPGIHQVTLEVAPGGEPFALGVAAVAALTLLGFAAWDRRRRPSASSRSV